MKLTKTYLQRLINKEMRLFEAAANIQTVSQNMALFMGEDSDVMIYMLYDPKSFLDIIKLHGSVSRTPNKELFVCVKAVVAVEHKRKGRAWDAAQVIGSAAVKGFGPLLYDIAMATEDGLMADRGTVSKSARNVWSYYKSNRDDVTAKLLDDMDNPKTKTKKDDAMVHDGGEKNPLNYAYFIKTKPNISTLIKNHQITKKSLNLVYADAIFNDLADEFFQLKNG